jgi:beta-N-acetylhexosaminidase
MGKHHFSRVLALFLCCCLSAAGIAQTPRPAAGETVWVEKTLKSLTLRQKLGQLIVVAVNGEFANANDEKLANIRKQINELHLGGVIVSWGGPHEIAALANELQRASKLPLFVAADFERGLRMRSRNGTPFTTAMGVGATGDPQAAFRQGKIMAQEMRAIGVNWLYGPVADINNNPDNPVINIRSYGASPQRVAEFVAAAVRGVREGGALATLKHFPGHGDTATDSHIGLPVQQFDRKRLDEVELVPFRAGLAAGADSVMTAHIALPNITGDNLPATLNPKISTDLLRRELGFGGIITTDSLGMKAITDNYPNGGAAVQAVKAGADVALLPPDPKAALDALENAVKTGELTEERINQSVRRLLRAKHRLGLANNRFVDLNAVGNLVEKPENMREANVAAGRSITLLRHKDNFFPLTPDRAKCALFIILAADDDAEEGRALTPEILRRAPRARVIKADPRTASDEYAKILAGAQNAETIIIAPFVKRAALKGTVAMPENQARFVSQILALNKPTGIIAFGSPYLIRQFPDAPVYAVAYAIEEVAQHAAARAMFGETPFIGKLPVGIPGLFEIGAGY